MGSAANPATSANVEAWSVIVAGESRSAGAVVTKAKYRRVWRPIVTVMLGVIDRSRMVVLFGGEVTRRARPRPSCRSRLRPRRALGQGRQPRAGGGEAKRSALT